MLVCPPIRLFSGIFQNFLSLPYDLCLKGSSQKGKCIDRLFNFKGKKGFILNACIQMRSAQASNAVCSSIKFFIYSVQTPTSTQVLRIENSAQCSRQSSPNCSALSANNDQVVEPCAQLSPRAGAIWIQRGEGQEERARSLCAKIHSVC